MNTINARSAKFLQQQNNSPLLYIILSDSALSEEILGRRAAVPAGGCRPGVVVTTAVDELPLLALIFTAVDVGPDAAAVAVVKEEDSSAPEEWPLEVDEAESEIIKEL